MTFSDAPAHEYYGGASCGYSSAYFYPGNPVTRGQMSKMVSNAAGYTDSVAGRTPSYSDVATTDTYFQYVERLVMHAVNAEYPPGVYPQPNCPSQPCFFTYSNAKRADIVNYISAAYLSRMNGSTPLGSAQVFALIGGPYPTYDGVPAMATTPNPAMNDTGNQVAGPVGLTDEYNNHFIEAGPVKIFEVSEGWGLHPYGNWWDFKYQGTTFYYYPNITLTPGSPNLYKAFYVGNGIFKSQYCGTNPNACVDMVTTLEDIGQSALPYAALGGEATQMTQSFGSITFSGAQVRANGVWSSWCYNPAEMPWRTLSGWNSTCYTSGNNPYSWTANYSR